MNDFESYFAYLRLVPVHPSQPLETSHRSSETGSPTCLRRSGSSCRALFAENCSNDIVSTPSVQLLKRKSLKCENYLLKSASKVSTNNIGKSETNQKDSGNVVCTTVSKIYRQLPTPSTSQICGNSTVDLEKRTPSSANFQAVAVKVEKSSINWNFKEAGTPKSSKSESHLGMKTTPKTPRICIVSSVSPTTPFYRTAQNGKTAYIKLSNFWVDFKASLV